MSPDEQNVSDPGADSTGQVSLAEEVVTQLEKAAQEVSEKSYSPYSGCIVGAAVLANSGRIYVGTNVENASYGLSICAERAAVSAAIAAGEAEISAVAVYSKTAESFVPCGACLGFISEFACEDTVILMFTENGKRRVLLTQLLPERFKLNPKETI